MCSSSAISSKYIDDCVCEENLYEKRMKFIIFKRARARISFSVDREHLKRNEQKKKLKNNLKIRIKIEN
jgi:hypothetical protein